MSGSASVLLRNARFRSLAVARTLVFFGNALGIVGLSFGVLRLPGGTGGELGVVLLARSAAQIALLLAGGVLGDRYSKTRVMMFADLTAGLSQLGIGLLAVAGHNDRLLLVLLASANGAATGLFMPASTGVVPELVSGADLQPANALLRVSINTATFVGSAVAGILVSAVGAGTTLVVNAVMYFGSVLFLSRVRVRAGARTQGAGFVGDLVEGWRTFTATRWIWVIVTQAAVINALFRGATQVLGPVEADKQPHGATLWGIALGAQSVGLFVGSAVAFRLRVRFPLRVATVCISLLACPLFMLAGAMPLLWVGAAMFVTGVAADLFSVFWETALQRNVEPGALSRVSSYDTLGSFALAPLGLLAAGLLSDSSAATPALAVGGVVIVVVGLLGLLARDVRDLPAPDVAPVTAAPPVDLDQPPATV